jgi:bacterioferritin B
VTSTCSANVPFARFSANPAFTRRLQTTGHFLQRGRLLQQRFLGLMTLATVKGGIASGAMAADAFVSLLNEQIAHEYAAHQQYVACAVYYDAETLPQLARFFYAQALEERDHAMMMVQYLIDADEEVVIPGVAAPQVAFADIVAPVALALEQEKRVTKQINALAGCARAEGDYTSEQFMQWFIKEQVEEVATMSDLLRVVERSRDDVMEVENYMAREQSGGEDTDPTAPRPAGA